MNDENDDEVPLTQVTRDALTRGAESERFLKTLTDIWSNTPAETDALAQIIAELHNENVVDAVALFSSLSNNGPAFFPLRHIFESALPQLEADVTAVLKCVQHLVREAGQDLAAGTILGDFIKFASQNPNRTAEALAAVEANPELMDLLPAVLKAGCQTDMDRYVQEALRFVRSEDAAARQQAVFALGSMNWTDGEPPPAEVFVAIEGVQASAESDDLLGTIVSTAVNLIKYDKDQEARMLAVVDAALNKGADCALHAASKEFAFADKDTSESVIETLLKHLNNVNPENAGTIDNIDHGLYRMIKRGKAADAIAFAEELLVTHELKPTTLDSMLRDVQGDTTLLNKAVTRWLLRGDPSLCRAAEWLAGGGHGANLTVEVDPVEIDVTNPANVHFLANKVVGYLFFNPVSAASMLVSLIRILDDKRLVIHIANLLLNPILINFPGKAGSFVTQQQALGSETQQRLLTDVRAALDEYFDDLRAIGELPELHPSEGQRESYHRYQSRELAESMKVAEEKSVFTNLFSRQTLLYGRTSITYVRDAQGTAHRQEIPLKSHSIEFEYPRVAQLDPLGLEYDLMTYRMERWRQ